MLGLPEGIRNMQRRSVVWQLLWLASDEMQAQRKEQAQNWSPQSVSASPAAWYNFRQISGAFTPPPMPRLPQEMGVSKNRGTPKWMIYMEIHIKTMILGKKRYFRKHPNSRPYEGIINHHDPFIIPE